MPGRERVETFIASVVAGDRIAEERFVYDTASAWTIVDSGGNPDNAGRSEP
jgi:hypothetical protein